VSDSEDSGEVPPELCQLCGVIISNGSQVRAVVRGSSAIHAMEPNLDGQRLVTACSNGYHATLQEIARGRCAGGGL
jgi:hypothetical protein